MRVTIITIGDEILIGQVVDTNSAWIGKKLAELGITVQEIRSIKDNAAHITSALKESSITSDIVLITGGLGPTKDDITKKTLAEFMGVEMVFDKKTHERIVALFSKFGKELKDSHLHQCYMPTNATILENSLGTAPGMLFDYEDAYYISMPGVPHEMKGIMKQDVLPWIKEKLPLEDRVYSRTIMTVGQGETGIEDSIQPIISKFGSNTSVAYLPSLNSVRVRITSKGYITEEKPKVDQFVEEISTVLGDIIYGYDGVSLGESLMELCVKKGLWVGTAESCTGGFVSHSITKYAGSSSYYKGSAITYTNELKQKILGVNESTLTEYGAVSEATVIEMAKGALKLLDCDIVVSISGIAGPSGGSLEKPVGTIWMCVANASQSFSFKINATKDRVKNIEYSGVVALNAIRKFIMKHY